MHTLTVPYTPTLSPSHGQTRRGNWEGRLGRCLGWLPPLPRRRRTGGSGDGECVPACGRPAPRWWRDMQAPCSQMGKRIHSPLEGSKGQGPPPGPSTLSTARRSYRQDGEERHQGGAPHPADRQVRRGQHHAATGQTGGFGVPITSQPSASFRRPSLELPGPHANGPRQSIEHP